MNAPEPASRQMYRRPDHVIWDNVDGGLRLCHLHTGSVYELNRTAALLWDVVDGRETEELFAAIVNAFPAVDQDEIRRDVTELIGCLQGYGLLESYNVNGNPER